MLKRSPGLGAPLLLCLAIAACQATPSPTPSTGESIGPFVSTSFPVDAPADCAYGGELAQIRAVDRLTVEFSLCYPDGAFLSKIALPNNAIQDSDWLARYGPNQRLRVKANGTGPYLVTDGVPTAGDQISLGRFDGYWGEKAKAATLLVRWDADPAARMLALRTGTVDGIDNPSPDAVVTIQGDPTLQLQSREELSTLYVGMSNTFQPFDSVKIRRALAMGIDRQRIVDDVFPPGSALADYFTPCSIQFGCEGDGWFDHDIGAAKALLVKPGFPGKLTTHIYYPDAAACGLPHPGLVAQQLQAQLNDDLGIVADLQPQGSATFLHNLSGGLLDGLYVMEWCPGSADASGFLDNLFNNPANPQFGTIDPSISNPLLAADRTADPQARQAAYAEANNAIRDLVPMIPLAHGSSATGWKADVTGPVSSPLDDEQFATMDPGGRTRLVWMQGASPSSFYCADTTDRDSARVCQNVFESLYGFKPGTAELAPSLAESCAPNQELTVWTCHLRSGVTFHDGSSLDAADVLASFVAQWDSEQPMHAGRTGAFAGWVSQFGPFLNAPAATP
jgi:peptide/nickel transport system substrate-binding protein